MANNLVIVESPAKAKTIEKYLGKNFTVRASIGHIKDLPPKEIGVDIKNNFKPTYEVIKGKSKVITELKGIAQKVETVYLAPDPDREGEAIAWHVAEEIQKLKNSPKIHRVLFNEITKKAIQEAMAHPTELDKNKYEAQQARRILDRLVGYQISPLLWDKVRRGLSAGRVQSVAVRVICEREEEIKAFKSEEYWTIEVNLHGSVPPEFIGRLHKKQDTKIEIGNQKISTKIVEDLKKEKFVLKEIQKKEQNRNSAPPFITSTLQQEAARKLGFTAKKTMMLAQRLYEGVEVGDDLAGLITYMRTDSTRISPTALDEVRAYIASTYGKEYLPEHPNAYKSKKGAQDAHEAIRPTSMNYRPEDVEKYLERDALRLYELIWKRFIACQMRPAIFDRTFFIIMAGDYELRSSGSIIKFPGFITVYTEGKDEEQMLEDEEGKVLPPLKEGEILQCLGFNPAQHFTEPPPRFTEASLVKELEEKGIGRPSTYASILSVIQDKKYAEKFDGKRFRPTDLGFLVNNLLVQNFPRVMDMQFTAKMENELDEVEEGRMNWVDSLKGFYGPFLENLEQAKVHMRDIKRQEILTDIKCDKCGNKMVIKFGRHGEFLACQTYPDCNNTKEFKRDEAGKIVVEVAKESGEVCDKCGSKMIIKRGRFGQFLACSSYPECKNTKAISIGVKCPLCSKDLTQRKTKRGKIFYGCTGYPACTFASWDKPINEKCPDCGAAYLVEKLTKARGEETVCAQKGCGYKKVT